MKAWWRGGRRAGRGTDRRRRCPRVLVTLASTDEGDRTVLRPRDNSPSASGSTSFASLQRGESACLIEVSTGEDELADRAEVEASGNNNGTTGTASKDFIDEENKCSREMQFENRLHKQQSIFEGSYGAKDDESPITGTGTSVEEKSRKHDINFLRDTFGKSLTHCGFYISESSNDLENLVVLGEGSSRNCTVDVEGPSVTAEHRFMRESDAVSNDGKPAGDFVIENEQEYRHGRPRSYTDSISQNGGISFVDARKNLRGNFSKLISPNLVDDSFKASVMKEQNTNDSLYSHDAGILGHTLRQLKSSDKNDAMVTSPSEFILDMEDGKLVEDSHLSSENASKLGKSSNANISGNSKEAAKDSTDGNTSEMISFNGDPVRADRNGEHSDEKVQSVNATKERSSGKQPQRGLPKLQIPPIPPHLGTSLSHTSPTPLDVLIVPGPQTAPAATRKSLPPMLLSPNSTAPDESSGGSFRDGHKFSFPLLRRHSHTTLHRSESMASITFRSLVSFVQEDNLQGLQNFLDSKRVAVDDRDENGTTALMVAAAKGKLTFVRVLLNHSAEVNSEDGDNWTALLCASKEGHTDIVSILLDHGANLEQRDMGGWTALMWACYKGRTETAHLLLEKGADVTAHGNYHIPSLLWAAGRGHPQIVNDLLAHGAKPNVADKYGTSALVWACRKGHIEIVESLLKAGAHVDTAGMYSWTPLLVATIGGYSDIVHRLLERKPNTNAVDKDGCTALTHACKDGYMPIVVALLNAGAYINIQDRAGDTNLIHAVKGGHRGVVEALLKKYADVDIPGKDRKTATYWAVEKNNAPMLRILLTANPDLEIATKDGDTPLLRAVRVRSIELVQLLLDKKAKVTAADKKGDTALHIAMRARSKGIVEVLLHNPKNSQLLYRPNRALETPYNIDISHQKTILSQIYGARRLNTSEDSEAMLGYDLYSSALADILSEPSLSLPITVGLYARWGSGKSFLLSKLRDEMNNFARQWMDPVFQFSSLLFLAVCHVAMVGGAITGLAFRSWIAGVATGGGIIAITYAILLLVWYSSQRYDWYWPYNFNVTLTRKLNTLKLVLQVMFCHPPGESWSESLQAQPIRFYFSEQTRVSNTTGGESSIVQMVASLYDAIETDYGALPTRLYRAFRPRPLRATSSWRWRRICCLPYVVVVVFTIMCSVALALCLSIYLQDMETFMDPSSTERLSLVSTMSALGAVITVAILANLGTWGRMAKALVFPHRRHLQRALRSATIGSSSGDSPSLRTGGFLHALRAEVGTMTEMVRCLDGFCGQQQSRLVAVVDGLDACEQEKVLLVMDAVQVLLSQAETRQAMSPSSVANASGGAVSQSTMSSSTSAPFIIILAIDPHVISRALETNLRRYGNEWGPGGSLGGIAAGGTGTASVTGLGPGNVGLVGGMAYLRNIVHLPFFLQSSGPRRLRAAAALRQHGNRRRNISECLQDEQALRRLSSESGISHTERQRLSERSSITGERLRRKGTVSRLLPSDSICSSLGSNLNRAGGAGGAGGPFDLSKRLLADDYFSDVNPRSMRRLMNIVHITGRLLKAFQVDFSWYHLANWVNVTEQWPFRISFLGLHCETHSNSYDPETPLKEIYDQIRDEIPAWREMCPLVDLDREERKFDVFLSYHKASLHLADLELFLPFTINLDPYIKKVIREEQQNMEDRGIPITPPAAPPIIGSHWPMTLATHQQQQQHQMSSTPLPWSNKSSLVRRNRPVGGPKSGPAGMIGPGSTMLFHGGQQWQQGQMQSGWHYLPPQEAFLHPKPAPITAFPSDLMEIRLSGLTVCGVCDLIGRLPDVTTSLVPGYQEIARKNNLSGRVLLHCDLDELKKVLCMNFGDWELFRILIIALREQECVSVTQTDEIGLAAKNVRFASSRVQYKEEVPTSSGYSTSYYSNKVASDSKPMLSGPAVVENASSTQFVPVVSVTSPSSDQLSSNIHDVSSPLVVDSIPNNHQPLPVNVSHHSIETGTHGSPVKRTSSIDNPHVPSVMDTTLNQESRWDSQAKDLHMSQSFPANSRGSLPAINKEESELDLRHSKFAEQRSKSGNYSHSSSPPVSISGVSSPPQMWTMKQQNQLEKQVMMEEEMICEALQALNQDALAEVLDEEENTEEEGSVNLNDDDGGRRSINIIRGGRDEDEVDSGGFTNLEKKVLTSQLKMLDMDKITSEKNSSIKLADRHQGKSMDAENMTNNGVNCFDKSVNINFSQERKTVLTQPQKTGVDNNSYRNDFSSKDTNDIDCSQNYVFLVEDAGTSSACKTSPYIPFRKPQISLASQIDGSPVSTKKSGGSSPSIEKINRLRDKVIQMVTKSCVNKEGFKTIERSSDEAFQHELSLEDEVLAMNGCEVEGDESTPLVSETSTPSEWSFDNDVNTGNMNHAFSENMLNDEKDCNCEQRDVHSWAGEKRKRSSSGEDSNLSITPQHSFPICSLGENLKETVLPLDSKICQGSTNNSMLQVMPNGVAKNSCSWSGRCKRKLYRKKIESHSVPRMYVLSDRKNYERWIKDEKHVFDECKNSAEKLKDENDAPALMRVLENRNISCQSSPNPIEEVDLSISPDDGSNKECCQLLKENEVTDSSPHEDQIDSLITSDTKSDTNPETSV